MGGLLSGGESGGKTFMPSAPRYQRPAGIIQDVPQQENGFDCGVFTSQFAECLSRRDGLLDFAQENITYFRKKVRWKYYDGAF